jgi:hypothetical protein
VNNLISNKTFWRWFVILAYIGIMFWMGFTNLHRAHPAVFFGALTILTLALIFVFRFLYRPEKNV